MYSSKSSGNSTLFCNVGSTRVPPECPWIARKYKKCSDELGFKQYWNIFFCPPPFAKKLIHARIDQCEVPSNYDLNIDATSSNLTAPSSSWWTDSSCCSNLIINFDTPKQPWLNIPGPISIHLRSFYGIGTQDNVKVGVGRGLVFEQVALYSSLQDLPQESLLTFQLPFTIRSQEQVLSRNFDLELHTVTSLMVTVLHLQDWTGLRVSTDPPFHLGWLITSRKSTLSTWSHQFVKCITIKCTEDCPFSIFFEKPALEQSLVISLVQKDLRISTHIHTTIPCTSASVWGIW